MMQERVNRKHTHDHHGSSHGSGLDVAKLRRRAAEAAKDSLEQIDETGAESRTAELARHAEHAASHELEHIEHETAKKAPERLCMRRAKFSLEKQKRMHGGCGSL